MYKSNVPRRLQQQMCHVCRERCDEPMRICAPAVVVLHPFWVGKRQEATFQQDRASTQRPVQTVDREPLICISHARDKVHRAPLAFPRQTEGARSSGRTDWGHAQSETLIQSTGDWTAGMSAILFCASRVRDEHGHGAEGMVARTKRDVCGVCACKQRKATIPDQTLLSPIVTMRLRLRAQ